MTTIHPGSSRNVFLGKHFDSARNCLEILRNIGISVANMSEKDGGWPMVTPLHPWELAGDLSQSEKNTYCWGLCGKPVSQGRKLRTCSSSKTYSVSLVQIHIYMYNNNNDNIIIINNNNINIHIYIYTLHTYHTLHYITFTLH